ncbi:MAG: glycosyltransferase [Planctomycetia bacterium]|nr:glycosyltransferase [Planctomycetia bacterium]
MPSVSTTCAAVAPPQVRKVEAAPGATGQLVRVVHLVNALEIGGLEKFVCDLVRLSDTKRFAPTVVCLQSKGLLAADLESAGIPVINLDCPSLAKGRTTWCLFHLLRRLRPAVLHTHNPTPQFFGAPTARLLGVPVVVHTKHGQNYPHRMLPVTKNRVVSWFTDCVVPVSEAAARVATQIERIPEHKVQTIWNGIDLERFPPRATQGKTGCRVIHVARLSPVKDQATLLRAARLVADRHTEFRLDIVGGGPCEADLKQLHAQLDLGERVRFLGYRADVGLLLRQADVFVLPSLTEGVSLTLLEAMASSLPIVATAVGGNGEVVVPEETGLLVPPQSPAALAAALLEMLKNPERARRMGQRGRQRVEQLFDIRGVVRRYESLYLRLLRRVSARW